MTQKTDAYAFAERLLDPHLSLGSLCQLRERACPDSVGPAYGEVDEGSMEAVLAAMRPTPRDVFLDYGCGSGRWLVAAAGRVGRVVGVEYVEERARVAEAVVREAALDATVHVGDGAALAAVWAERPTLVLFYDVVCPSSARRAFRRRVAAEPSVRCVVSWSRRAPAGFSWRETLDVRTPAGERYAAHVYARWDSFKKATSTESSCLVQVGHPC